MVALACGYVVAVKQFHPDSVPFPPPAPPTLRVKVQQCTCTVCTYLIHYQVVLIMEIFIVVHVFARVCVNSV